MITREISQIERIDEKLKDVCPATFKKRTNFLRPTPYNLRPTT